MGINFRTETFRDDFTFRNSPEHIRRFPFPFNEDAYMYAVNIEPHVVGPKGSVLENLIDVDEHYVAEMQDRALVLAEDPLRCQSLPHMTLAVSGRTIRVDEQQSLLEAIEAAGVDPPYLCRGGVCGQCETNVISYDGKFIHNDHWLSEEDHRSGCKIMPCVSRFEGRSLVLER